MSTSPNKKMFTFQKGCVIKPLYDKCPQCGCRLDEFYQSINDEANTSQIKDHTDKAWGPSGMDSLKWWQPIASWYFFFVHRMVHPFSNTEDDAAKANYKRLPNRVIAKKASPIKQHDKGTNCDKHLVPGIKGKLR